MSCIEPGQNASEPLAQCLVGRGYKNCSQRVYLVRLMPALEAAKHDRSEASRFGRWHEHGCLEAADFTALLKTWLEEGRERIASRSLLRCSAAGAGAFQVDIGLTFDGLERVGLPPQLLDLLRIKAPAFSQGSLLRAARALGDVGASDPMRWEPQYRDKLPQVLVFVHASKPEGFLAFERSVAEVLKPSEDGVPELLAGDWIECGDFTGDAVRTHFGMADGISSPRFCAGEGCKADAERHSVHRLGELLLGHPRNDGSNTWLVSGARATRSGHREPTFVPRRETSAEFFRDGTFGAFRKMQQDVAAFKTTLETLAEAHRGETSAVYAKAWFKAKMLGRWDNGQRIRPEHTLTRSGQRLATDAKCLDTAVPAGAADRLNEFDFSDDKAGFGCPYGAHIRRMNPRADAVVPIMRRPLLRRGKPYTRRGPDDQISDCGLLGLFLCASLEEQFEHLLGAWANNLPMGMGVEAPGKDPIVGSHDTYGDTFTIPVKDGEPRLLKGFAPFVVTRGTVYVFFPGVEALKSIVHRSADLTMRYSSGAE